jgi:molybdopterin-containing oxidoreductase family iron-sulfur binding subunit
MEKCTFCIQRLNRAEEDAKRQNVPLNSIPVQPACAQACPSDVFAFGLLSDPESRVSRMARSARAYRMLDDLGTEPRIIYLSGGGGGERTQQP